MLLKRYSSLGERKLKKKLERLVFSFYTNLIRFRIGVNKLRVVMTLNAVYLKWVRVFTSLQPSHTHTMPHIYKRERGEAGPYGNHPYGTTLQ